VGKRKIPALVANQTAVIQPVVQLFYPSCVRNMYILGSTSQERISNATAAVEGG